MEINIDPEFASLIPPLSKDERMQLQSNLIEHGGARDPLVVWICDELVIEDDEAGTQQVLKYDDAIWRPGDGEYFDKHRIWEVLDADGNVEDELYEDDWPCTLLDGHNRYEICTEHCLDFDVHGLRFESREDAADWIDRNQLGRRNLHPDAFTLLLGRRYNRAKRQGERTDLTSGQSDQKSTAAERIAAEHNVGEKTVRRAGKVAEAVEKVKVIAPDIEHRVAAGTGPARAAVVKAAEILEQSPERAREIIAGDKKIADVIREEKRAAVVAQLEDVAAKEAKELAGVYDVVVIDPPWPMEKIERDVTPEQVAFEYPTMQEAELAAMELPLADDCHVWVWTTHRFLPMCLRLLGAWNLKYVCTFVWHKPGGFQPFGLPQYNCEFAVYARRGKPQFVDVKAFPACFNAPRGAHSEKPEEFYELLRRVTAGRRLDMFNRRQIEGFDTWGNEAK